MGNLYIEVGKSLKSSTGRWYKILEYLGKGANAYAYKCTCTTEHDEYTGLEFALKIQYNLSSEKRKQRFFEESDFLRQNNHPALIVHFDSGMYDYFPGYPFMVTSYMPMTLQKRMEQGDISFEDKVKYSCQLLNAISYLGRKKVVHRDIKPSNIFISDNHAILGDFGIAKSLNADNVEFDGDDAALLAETVLGESDELDGYTIMPRNYRTPELVKYANKEDALRLESDVFQLGLVLTELFTGVNPLKVSYNRKDDIELEEIERISYPVNGGLIHTTLQKMLELDYSKRIGAERALSAFVSTNQAIHLGKSNFAISS